MTQLADVDQSFDGHQYDGREDCVGQRPEESREEQQDTSNRHRSEDQRKRRACTAPLVHRRLGETAGDRIALKKAGQKTCRAKAEQFLPRTHVVAVLKGKGSGGGDAFDVRKEETRTGEPHKLAHFRETESTEIRIIPAELRQACGDFADNFDAVLLQVAEGNRQQRQQHHGQRDGAPRKQFFADE